MGREFLHVYCILYFQTQIKRNILNKSKQQLRRIIAQDYHKQRELNNQLTSISNFETTKRIRTQNHLVYNASSKLHGDRFNFERNLTITLRSNNLNATNNYSYDNISVSTQTNIVRNQELVTDLTKTLVNEEINLLAKGPKFNLAGNNNTINEFYTSFYRLANCIRWKEHNKVTQSIFRRVNIMLSLHLELVMAVKSTLKHRIFHNLKQYARTFR